MELGTIIVGAGQAAGELAPRLRQLGYAAPITIIGTELHLPYQRPPLSKGFLLGDIDEAALLVRSAGMYQQQNIGFLPGTTVTSIDRTMRSITLSHGSPIGFDKLVLATGGRARTLTCPGAALHGVHTLRTLDDVVALRRQFMPGSALVIIGGGYVGLEVAAVAIKCGVAVTLIEAKSRVLARVAGFEISAFYEKAHRDAGVTLVTGATVKCIVAAADAQENVGGVELDDGRHIAADFVLAGIGLIPNTELAAAAELRVEDGVWVDEYCRTEDPDILAIGDCSNHPSAFLGRRIRLESVPNALEQARIAAQTLCGDLVPYDAVPWFWSDQYDLKLQAVGMSQGYDQVVLRGSMAERAFTAFYFRDGVLIAADSVNRPGEFAIARKLVGDRCGNLASILADPRVDLKQLLRKAA